MKYMDGIVPVMNVGGSNNNGNNGFDGNNGWWIILVLLFALGGNNWGNRGGNSGNGDASSVLPYLMARDTTGGSLTRGDLCMDMNFNDLQNAVRNGVAENNSNFRTIDNAICTLGYDNLVQASGINMNIANGFSRLDTNLCQSFNNVAQQVNGLSSQLATCCCGVERSIDGVNYNLAMNTNQLQNAMCSNTRDVIENANNNTRAILDFLTNDKISTLQAENQNLRLAASQERQNAYLIDQLKPCPSPSYIVPNPNCCYGNFGFNGFNGCN